MKVQVKTNENKTAFLVVDTRNGLFDGFYINAVTADCAMQRWQNLANKYCLKMNLMIAEVSQEQINNGISDEKFMATAWHNNIAAGCERVSPEAEEILAIKRKLRLALNANWKNK